MFGFDAMGRSPRVGRLKVREWPRKAVTTEISLNGWFSRGPDSLAHRIGARQPALPGLCDAVGLSAQRTKPHRSLGESSPFHRCAFFY